MPKVKKCSPLRKMEAIGFEIDPTIDVVVLPTQWPVQSSTGICAFIVYSDCKMLPQRGDDLFVCLWFDTERKGKAIVSLFFFLSAGCKILQFAFDNLCTF